MSSLSIFFEDYDYFNAKQWLVETEPFLLKCIAAYVVAIFSIKYAMLDRKPFDLQEPLVLWNAALALFSVAGFAFTTPTFLQVISEHGIQHSYTHMNEMLTGQRAGYWTFLWVVSKIPELVDTFFLVLRKRPLMFMHWYHHVLTGWWAFVAFYEGNAYAVWLVWMNYFIHAVMYRQALFCCCYYCLRAMGVRIPPAVAQLITAAQIVQFLVAHVVMGHLAWIALTTSEEYAVTLRGFLIGAVMEISYLLLWLRFYYVSYLQRGGKKYVQHKRLDGQKAE